MGKVNRRKFLEGTLAASAGFGGVGAGPSATGAESGAKAVSDLPKRKLGKHDVGRLIIGANQFTGHPHAEPLKYAKELFAAYFTEEKIVETLAIGHDHGIDTHITLTDETCVKYLNRFEKEAGKRLQWIAQSHWFRPKPEGRKDALKYIKLAADNGAIACFLHGAACDGLVREKNVSEMEYYFDTIRKQGMLAGLAGHLNETIDVPIKAGITPDFIMKTINTVNYASKDREKTTAMMAEIELPWIAYKVLGAGRVKPEAGFRYAIEAGADFLNVGMFDFQVAENAELVRKLSLNTNRI
ncbi:MAG: hypothetical protein ISR77_09600 [Pirellulaceae bacterium]|nr:hypothetical protein [Pirellulaceae bacterium]